MKNDRHVHLSLLEQVADSREEAREVRRILGAESSAPGMRNLNVPRISWGQVHEDNLDDLERWKRAPFPIGKATHAHRYSRPACSRCESGLTHCGTPDACERADDPRPPPERGDLYRVLAMATWPLYVVAIGAFFAWMLT